MSKCIEADSALFTAEEVRAIIADLRTGDGNQILTAQETADQLRLSLRTTLDLLRGGDIEGAKVGKQWRVRQAAVDAFLSKPRRWPVVVGQVSADTGENRFVILGPTGSGKTELARELRERYPHASIEEVQVPTRGKTDEKRWFSEVMQTPFFQTAVQAVGA
ncbi:DNA binding domain, excisionase family [Mycobacteroides abscessus subsp. abscessus]|uniref:helix-turn-helix domain-containing protein n=1 Tax=Mycobacteroides abscessus TaxID=36809 RepID=UPI0009CF4925|nr:helix-turn-helix domain-containing protein [Mycobacteroides abscessus]SKM36327.1 DNA binding domain, excisionase family [Mycobacteroides abscessus subsp. abscessus]